ncbi:hypothetical protein BGY98DRAFT_959356, partial [Russula aff. rugulosa BPL654]
MGPLHTPVQQPAQKTPPAPSEEMWDTYLVVLKSQDLCQLYNPRQCSVILTLVH